jgi:hypothetical protein
MRKTIRWAAFWAGVLALVASGACKRAGKGDKEAEVEEALEPPAIAFFLELPSAHDLGDEFRQLIETVQPGGSALVAGLLGGMLPGVVGASSLEGADLARPLWLVETDQKEFENPSVLIVHIDDAEALAAAVGDVSVVVRGEIAAVGAQDAADAIAPYAEAVLAKRSVAGPRLVVFPATMIDEVRASIEAGKEVFAAELAATANAVDIKLLLDLYFDGALAAVEQTARAELELVGGAAPGILITLEPLADTTFAGFVTAQKPSTFSLIAALPPADELEFLVAGDLALGPLGEPLMELGRTLMSQMMAGVDPELADEFAAQFQGPFAVSGRALLTDPVVAAAFAVQDEEEARKLFVRQMEQLEEAGGRMEFLGVEQSVEFEAVAFAHEEVPVMRQRTVIVQAPPDTQLPEESIAYGAAAGGRMLHTLGEGADGGIRQMIDLAAGRGEGLSPPGALATLLSGSDARDESAVMVIAMPDEMQAQAPVSGVVLGLGFPSGTMQLRVGVAFE